MKLVSFNVNSLRQRLHQLQSVIDKHDPEIIGLQETKVQDEEFPREAIEAMGFQVIFTGQKTHYGVALLSRSPCSNPSHRYLPFAVSPEALISGSRVHNPRMQNHSPMSRTRCRP